MARLLQLALRMGALRYNLALVVANILFGVSFSVYVSLLQGTLRFEQLFAMQLLFLMAIFTPAAMAHKGFFRLSLNDFGSIFIVALLVVFGWIFTLITSIIAHSRRAARGEKWGVLIALSGVAAMLFDRGRVLVGEGGEGYGNTLILCAVASIAVNTVLISPVLRRHGTMVVMGWYYLIGTVLALPLLVGELPSLRLLQLSSAENAEIAYILLFGSALPMYLLYVGSEHLTATHTAVYRYIQPIVATLFAVVRGQSEIDRTNIVGAVLIFSGVLMMILSTPRSERMATRE